MEWRRVDTTPARRVEPTPMEWEVSIRRIPLMGYRVRAQHRDEGDSTFTITVSAGWFPSEKAARGALQRYLSQVTGLYTASYRPVHQRGPR